MTQTRDGKGRTIRSPFDPESSYTPDAVTGLLDQAMNGVRSTGDYTSIYTGGSPGKIEVHAGFARLESAADAPDRRVLPMISLRMDRGVHDQNRPAFLAAVEARLEALKEFIGELSWAHIEKSVELGIKPDPRHPLIEVYRDDSEQRVGSLELVVKLDELFVRQILSGGVK